MLQFQTKNAKSEESKFICDDDIESSPFILPRQTNKSTPTRKSNHNFEDKDFPPNCTSIQGSNLRTRKCRCNDIPILSFMDKPNQPPHKCKPYYHCRRKKCNYFAYAYTSEQVPWYRFGFHNQFILVQNDDEFKAEDLLQGRVGDCWFLSALAVIAQRKDLIKRLISNQFCISSGGKVEVRLFIDGWWRSVIVDNFLPCLFDEKKEQPILYSSMSDKYLSDAINVSESNIKAIHNTYELLQQKYGQKYGSIHPFYNQSMTDIRRRLLERSPTSQNLAYSKAKRNQLWVPFLEKAYAKSHGCYKSISGGHISEAFLDLTGCPTLSFELQNSKFDKKRFWVKLKEFRHQRLPMGCGTAGGADLNEVGLVGHHAYSILDIREFHISPFTDLMPIHSRSEIGNVSGFGDDGILRLVKLRNPHGKGEWKGDWSDQSYKWQTLLRSTSSSKASFMHKNDLCSMKDDGMFWMDYDHFLMAFHVVDVCLAFPNMHAKSFATSFPSKKSPQRCEKAYLVSIPDYAVIDSENDCDATNDSREKCLVEVYVMAIQKTRRGISNGQTDKKRSYKLCDSGFIIKFADGRVEGTLFGMRKNGHFRFVLNKSDLSSSTATVIPISFGHPIATDQERSLTVRFIGSGPLKIQPLEDIPELHNSLQKFCFKTLFTRVILDGAPYFRVFICEKMGGTVFIYLIVADDHAKKKYSSVNLQVVANVRGMSCRTCKGLENYESTAQEKKFQAAWRRFTVTFTNISKSRLLLVLVQSGQTWEVGSITCDLMSNNETTSGIKFSSNKPSPMNPLSTRKNYSVNQRATQTNLESFLQQSSIEKVSKSPNDDQEGIFAPVHPNQIIEYSDLNSNTSNCISYENLMYSQYSSQQNIHMKQQIILEENLIDAQVMEASRLEYEQFEKKRLEKVMKESGECAVSKNVTNSYDELNGHYICNDSHSTHGRAKSNSSAFAFNQMSPATKKLQNKINKYDETKQTDTIILIDDSEDEELQKAIQLSLSETSLRTSLKSKHSTIQKRDPIVVDMTLCDSKGANCKIESNHHSPKINNVIDLLSDDVNDVTEPNTATKRQKIA